MITELRVSETAAPSGGRSGRPHRSILAGLILGALSGVLCNVLWRDAPALD